MSCTNTLRLLWLPLRYIYSNRSFEADQFDNSEELSPPAPEIVHCLCLLPECKYFCSDKVFMVAKAAYCFYCFHKGKVSS